MILTAGQQEQGHGLTEPVLYGPLVQMAEPLVKWAVEVTRLEDLPRIVRRAAKIATTPPTGPVFISLPGDILNAEAGIELGRSTRVDTRVKPSDESLQALAAAHPEGASGRSSSSATRSSRATRCRRPPQLAETLGCSGLPVDRRPTARISCPRARASWARCRAIQKQVREVLSPYDLMIVLGADPLRMSVYSEVDPLPDGLPIVQIGLVDWDLAKNYGAEIALKADVQGNPARAGAGAEGRRRRRARGARQAGHRGAGVEELDGASASRWSSRFRKHARPFADRSGLAGAAGGRGDAGQRHPGRRGTDVVAADARRCARIATATAITRWPRAASAGDCRPRSASASPIPTGRWCASPATAARCIRSRRCGPRRITSCR